MVHKLEADRGIDARRGGGQRVAPAGELAARSLDALQDHKTGAQGLDLAVEGLGLALPSSEPDTS
jgi:hypothetical protein